MLMKKADSMQKMMFNIHRKMKTLSQKEMLEIKIKVNENGFYHWT